MTTITSRTMTLVEILLNGESDDLTILAGVVIAVIDESGSTIDEMLSELEISSYNTATGKNDDDETGRPVISRAEATKILARFLSREVNRAGMTFEECFEPKVVAIITKLGFTDQ